MHSWVIANTTESLLGHDEKKPQLTVVVSRWRCVSKKIEEMGKQSSAIVLKQKRFVGIKMQSGCHPLFCTGGVWFGRVQHLTF